MKAVLIIAHPMESSYNMAIKERAEKAFLNKGYEVVVRDLYKMGFNPVLSADDMESIGKGHTPEDIALEQKHISEADALVFIYPTWWENMPAIMRGYIDKVFSYGFAYRYTPEGPEGMLKGKKALSIQTTASPEAVLEGAGILEACKISIGKGIFDFVGLTNVGQAFLFAVESQTDEKRVEMLDGVEDIIGRMF